jgi:hypothetical protein
MLNKLLGLLGLKRIQNEPETTPDLQIIVDCPECDGARHTVSDNGVWIDCVLCQGKGSFYLEDLIGMMYDSIIALACRVNDLE